MNLATQPCPLCATPLAETRFAELQERVRREEEAKLESAKQQFESDYAGRLKAETEIAVRRALGEARAQIEAAGNERIRMVERIGQLEAGQATLSARHSEAIQRQNDKFKADLAAAAQRAQSETEKRLGTQLEALRTKSAQAAGMVDTLRADLDKARDLAMQQAEKAKQDVVAAERRAQAAAEQRFRSDAEVLRVQSVARSQEIEALRAELATAHENTQRQVDELVKAGIDAAQRSNEQELATLRHVLDNSHQREIQQLKSAHFNDTAKLQEKVVDLGRQLEKKTANELGDALEVDLLEALREEFRTDDIRKVEKGEPGVDIVHTVLHKGEVAGTIVLDSKNRKIWQDKFVEKLNSDKIAARADHAVLSTVKFPADRKDLFVQDDVIVAKPTQIVSIVRLLREHLLRSHALGLTKRDQVEKKERLYSFITSDRHRQLIDATDQAIRKLEEYDTEDERAHKNLLMKRGIARRSLEKSIREMTAEISAIVEASGDAVETRARA